MFEDAAEDFTSLSLIADKFEQWKVEHRDAYEQSYCTMSLPLVFAPYVRLELLQWNPFTEPAHASIDRMAWFTALLDYGSKVRTGQVATSVQLPFNTFNSFYSTACSYFLRSINLSLKPSPIHLCALFTCLHAHLPAHALTPHPQTR